MANKEEKGTERDFVIVSELPKTEVRVGISEDKEFDLITSNEALTELLHLVRDMNKRL